MKSKLFFFLVLISNSVFSQLPEGFVYAKDMIPDLEVDLRYCSAYNFVGESIDGYQSNRLILTKQTVNALSRIQDELKAQGLCLKVYDGYRPQRAVNHFIQWAKKINDTVNKAIFYPDVAKKDLFKEDYIAVRSGHSKGSTVDVTIIDRYTKETLDMGSPYDFFGEASWIDYEAITKIQKNNRQLLQIIMLKYGFRNYAKEWWHFTLREEPFPDTYFDFVIE